ncbi:MAG TPA: HpcH/HpaI aldolase/citrate lyase family protein [Candidatus Excrementavichristensenella intestinipullorum]|nr:HpcH/HpaI aldolase/citrate lyase family protein [Candidatus Excrementavichristensenella intestinipullorum]
MIRSMLFIPGNSPAMLQNADIHRADAIILDLEDAVSPDQKDAARILVRNAVRTLGFSGCRLIIRVNPIDTPYCALDVSSVVPLKPDMIMPTKVSGPQTVKDMSHLVAQAEAACGLAEGTVGLIPLLETCEGIENAYAIAKADPRVRALFLGAEDLTSDMRAKRTKAGGEIGYSRGRIVMAARAAGVEVYDTPFTDVNDEEGILQDVALAKSLGFTGKAAISPRHVEAINRAFSPTPEEIAYAQEVLEIIEEARRMGKGAIALRGKMIDKPIVDRAKYVLEMARMLGGKPE